MQSPISPVVSEFIVHTHIGKIKICMLHNIIVEEIFIKIKKLVHFKFTLEFVVQNLNCTVVNKWMCTIRYIPNNYTKITPSVYFN